ncbi:excalibur calcium-binding domain-containing protein [Novosphingobium resinovorum]
MDLAAAMLEKGLAIALDNAPASYAALADHSKAQRAGIWGSEFDAPAVYRAANPRNSGARVVSATVPRPVVARSIPPGAFRSCAEARAAGAAPMRRGQPGYNPQLDGDDDGIACEPYRRR